MRSTNKYLLVLRTIYRIPFLTAVVVLLSVGVVNAHGDKWLDDPGQLGHYAIGHINYQLVNKAAGDRPVFISV